MRLREREQDEREQRAGGEGGGDPLEAARAAGMRMLDAADRAIDRAVSGDSQHFLSSVQQHHGQ